MLQILVQFIGYTPSSQSWEPVEALRVDVPGLCRVRAGTRAAPAPLGPNEIEESA